MQTLALPSTEYASSCLLNISLTSKQHGPLAIVLHWQDCLSRARFSDCKASASSHFVYFGGGRGSNILLSAVLSTILVADCFLSKVWWFPRLFTLKGVIIIVSYSYCFRNPTSPFSMHSVPWLHAWLLAMSGSKFMRKTWYSSALENAPPVHGASLFTRLVDWTTGLGIPIRWTGLDYWNGFWHKIWPQN